MPIYSFYFICSLLLCTTFASAQSLRIGFVDKDSIIAQSKALLFIQSKVEKFRALLQTMLEQQEITAEMYLREVSSNRYRCYSPSEEIRIEKKLQTIQADLQNLAMYAERRVIAYQTFFLKHLEIQVLHSAKKIALSEGYNTIINYQSVLYPRKPVMVNYELQSKIVTALNAQFEEEEWQKIGAEVLNKSVTVFQQYKHFDLEAVHQAQAKYLLQYNPSFFYTYLTPLYYYSK